MMLEVRDLSVQAGAFELKDFSIKVAAGEGVALMGPSGCGKTTVLEAICGLREDGISGEILLDGVNVKGVPPRARGVGLVPQDIVLFPGMTVREHLEFSPRVRGWGRKAVRERAAELAEDLGLVALLDRLPGGLSGGESRRVALGRALAARPRLLCLDEALSGLDEETHREVLGVVRAMIVKEKVAALHVTHSRSEAEMIADRVVVM